ncbi:MAG TPA: DNA cytosine methyltransferase [Polyangiales bacterium]|nr:DNA cytosine methyltransferase [Polyangiales bacterium]
MRELVFRAAFPFGGSGAGALGFISASITLLGVQARFECVGGVDLDARACADFEYLTGTRQLCADIRSLTPADVRREYGHRAPHCIFLSPPCTGASGLLSSAKSKTPKYQEMNQLAEVWIDLMLAAWAADLPPLVLLENVPRLKSRAPAMIARVQKKLRAAGYVVSDGHHDCGELGGLAQRRRRYLLVARLPKKCAPFLYQPPARRVRGCGEVLTELPVPGTLAAQEWGRMHELPKLTWRNWTRLALIPAGGDWRDLEGVLEAGQAKREQFKRHAVEEWEQPVGTIGGSGSNGVANVADPRVTYAYDAGYGVLNWQAPARTIASKSAVGCGAYAVSDVRVGCTPRAGAYGVLRWADPSKTITGSLNIDNAFGAVADPRKPPPFPPVIIADDRTWHRPLTTLELAALQGFPLRVHGKPLLLSDFTHTSARTRIGNAVPPPAARAIAEKMLVTLTESALGAFSLSSDAVWVEPHAMA